MLKMLAQYHILDYLHGHIKTGCMASPAYKSCFSCEKDDTKSQGARD